MFKCFLFLLLSYNQLPETKLRPRRKLIDVFSSSARFRRVCPRLQCRSERKLHFIRLMCTRTSGVYSEIITSGYANAFAVQIIIFITIKVKLSQSLILFLLHDVSYIKSTNFSNYWYFRFKYTTPRYIFFIVY